MSLVLGWLWSMVTHWQSWVSGGGVGGLILIIIVMIEKFHPRGWTMPKRWYAVIIGAFFVLGASFMAWRDEHRRADRLQEALNSKPTVPASFQVTIPQQPPAQVQVTLPAPKPGASLKSRANKLAAELASFEQSRSKGFPDCISSANSTPAQLQACKDAEIYQQETNMMYSKRFSVRVVSIVQEFKAKGIDVTFVEYCAAYGICNPTPIPIALRAMAIRIDENGDVTER